MRTLRILAAFLALSALTACAFSARTVGQHDPTVEAIKALTEVLKQPKPLPTPPPAATPTPTPEGSR